MLCVGEKFPPFKMKAVVSTDPQKAFVEVNQATYQGKWLVVFAWPKDFTFVCPTEIVEYGKLIKEFADRGAQLLGLSTDSDFVHLAWRTHDASLTNSPFPWLADIKKELSLALGIVHAKEGVAYRATFIVDPDGVIRHITVNDLSVGRNPAETLRILDALQSGELCPCSWQKGDKFLGVKK